MSAPSILIVEDDAQLLGLYKLVLRNLPYTLTVVASGEAALESLNDQVPALVILDISMPGISGLDILRIIRADERFDDTKIVLVTALARLLDPSQVAMVDKVLAKPVTMPELKQTVSDLLNISA